MAKLTIKDPNPNPKCEVCGEPKEKATMQIVASDCWHCKKLMKMALILAEETFFGPESFTEEQMELARSRGVIIKNQLSKTTGAAYFANTCPACAAFIGEFFIHEYLYMEDENIDAGFYCLGCYQRKALGQHRIQTP